MRQTTISQFRKLHTAISLMLLLAFLAGGFTLAAHIWQDMAEDEEVRLQYNDRLARALATHAGGTIDEIDRSLQYAMSNLENGWPTSRRAQQDLLRRSLALTPAVQNLVLIDAKGNILADARERASEGMTADDRAYFRVHAEGPTNSLYIAPPIRSRFAGDLVQVASRPIRDEAGGLEGVIAAVVDPAHFTVLEDGFDTETGSRIALLGRDAGIHYIDPGAPHLLGDIEPAALPWLALGGHQRFRSHLLFDRVERDYSIYPLRQYHLNLVVGIPPRSWASVITEGFTGLLPGLLVLLALMTTMGLTFGRHLRRSHGAIVAAEERERQFSDVAHAVPGMLYQWRRTGPGRGHFTWVSPNSLTTLGLEPEDLLLRQRDLRLHPEDYARWVDSIEAALADGTNWNFEGRFILHDGSERHLHVVAGRFIAVADGHIHNGVVLDVTRERQQAVGMANAEGRLEMLLDAARDAIISLDGNLKITHFNKGAERLFGRNAATMVGNGLDPLLPPDFRSRHDALMQQMLAGPDGSREMSSWRKVNGMRADGSIFPLLASISKITVLGEPMLCAIMRDMSGEAASEQQLKDLANERQKLLVLAEQANAAKSKFLAIMSHELRTPLNAIIGFAELMKLQISGPLSARYDEYASDILSSGQHLLAIINDILDLTKLQERGGDFQFTPVNPVLAAEDAMLFIKGRAAEKDIAIVIADQVGGADVIADERALRQMLINLLANAVKYTPSGGRIEVSVSKTPDRIVIDVSDNGPGVAPDLLHRLGKPFVQDRESYKAENSGTGLGLAIVSELVAAHHGNIRFGNRPEGGFRASLDFPQAALETSKAA